MSLLAAAAPLELDFSFEDDDWFTPSGRPKLPRATSVGNSWGVTSIGGGYDWSQKKSTAQEHDHFDLPENDEHDERSAEAQRVPRQTSYQSSHSGRFQSAAFTQEPAGSHLKPPLTSPSPIYPTTMITPSTPQHIIASSPAKFTTEPLSLSPTLSPTFLSRPHTPTSPSLGYFAARPPPPSRSPTSPRPRRRSSQQRVSLIAGRVSIAPIEHPAPPTVAVQKLIRTGSSASLLSVAPSTCPPTPAPLPDSGSDSNERSISEFVIQGELGRGAYGLVKKAREMKEDGTLGPPLVIKQVIKSRILADCWKKHLKHGTIPIEIYVMSAVSNTSYVLPSRRPWDPARFTKQPSLSVSSSSPSRSPSPAVGSSSFEWLEGKVVKGHPNICPLLDFFEDNHYYYLILPSTIPEPLPNHPIPPSDLFDLVESYPDGLPPSSIRTYLGQIADALSFLHARGIVHRDIKDENVVLGPNGRRILIDFGSSGLVKKGGWDTFSGTLDYAGPEILRGERYEGKEQDVWAFGVVAYVLLVGECPFTTAADAQAGLESPFCSASMSLDERCGDDHEAEGEEEDSGGSLGDAAALVRACLQVDLTARPTFDKILQSRFLAGEGGWR